MDSTSSLKLTYIPEEILREILLRLPAKSLIMCTAVCKSWSCLIKRCNFIDAHLSRKLSFQSNHQIVDGCQVLLLENHKFNLLSCYGDILFHNPELPGGAADYITGLMNPPILNEDTGCFDMVQTCNGVICLTSTNNDDIAATDIFIWNPSIRRYVVLPRPNFIAYLNNYDIVRHYFGYDSHTNDYKVLRCVSNLSTQVAVEIYSLARGSWKTLTASAPTYFGFGTDTWPFSYWAVVNDALHWVRPRVQRGKDLVIVSFDMSTELFGEIMMPQGLRKIEPRYVDSNIWISKHKGSVALLECSNMFTQSSDTQLHLWVMEEYGVVESWTKLYTYSMAEYFLLSLGFNFYHEHVFMLDIRKTLPPPPLKNLGNGESQKTLRGDIMDFFVESLVLLGHPNAISY
ncbi:hypothetical protein GBA52_003970 [Prunus armeniaca]|nr:hypothetical protein GBA52_003970 [Prunus armeniaca]